MARRLPEELDKVYMESRKGTGQPNGYVHLVLWEDETAIVKFHSDQNNAEDFVEVSFDTFDAGRYARDFGGTWYLSEP